MRGAGLVPAIGAGLVPTTGTGLIPTTGTGLVPTTGADLVLTTGAGLIPATGADLMTGAGLVPTTGTDLVPMIGTGLILVIVAADLIPVLEDTRRSGRGLVPGREGRGQSPERGPTTTSTRSIREGPEVNHDITAKFLSEQET